MESNSMVSKNGDTGIVRVSGRLLPKSDIFFEAIGILEELINSISSVSAEIQWVLQNDYGISLTNLIWWAFTTVLKKLSGESKGEWLKKIEEQVGRVKEVLIYKKIAMINEGIPEDDISSRDLLQEKEALKSDIKNKKLLDLLEDLETTIYALEADLPEVDRGARLIMDLDYDKLAMYISQAYTLSRKAERIFKKVLDVYGTDSNLGEFLNRLSDYFMIIQRGMLYLNDFAGAEKFYTITE